MLPEIAASALKRDELPPPPAEIVLPGHMLRPAPAAGIAELREKIGLAPFAQSLVHLFTLQQSGRVKLGEAGTAIPLSQYQPSEHVPRIGEGKDLLVGRIKESGATLQLLREAVTDEFLNFPRLRDEKPKAFFIRLREEFNNFCDGPLAQEFLARAWPETIGPRFNYAQQGDYILPLSVPIARQASAYDFVAMTREFAGLGIARDDSQAAIAMHVIFDLGSERGRQEFLAAGADIRSGTHVSRMAKFRDIGALSDPVARAYLIASFCTQSFYSEAREAANSCGSALRSQVVSLQSASLTITHNTLQGLFGRDGFSRDRSQDTAAMLGIHVHLLRQRYAFEHKAGLTEESGELLRALLFLANDHSAEARRGGNSVHQRAIRIFKKSSLERNDHVYRLFLSEVLRRGDESIALEHLPLESLVKHQLEALKPFATVIRPILEANFKDEAGRAADFFEAARALRDSVEASTSTDPFADVDQGISEMEELRDAFPKTENPQTHAMLNLLVEGLQSARAALWNAEVPSRPGNYHNLQQVSESPGRQRLYERAVEKAVALSGRFFFNCETGAILRVNGIHEEREEARPLPVLSVDRLRPMPGKGSEFTPIPFRPDHLLEGIRSGKLVAIPTDLTSTTALQTTDEWNASTPLQALRRALTDLPVPLDPDSASFREFWDSFLSGDVPAQSEAI